MTRTPSAVPLSPTRAADGDLITKHAANDNASGPIVVLTPIGDGIALAQVLARILVRRELLLANAIPDLAHCQDEHEAG